MSLDDIALLQRVRQFMCDQRLPIGRVRPELVAPEEDVFAIGEGARLQSVREFRRLRRGVDAHSGEIRTEARRHESLHRRGQRHARTEAVADLLADVALRMRGFFCRRGVRLWHGRGQDRGRTCPHHGQICGGQSHMITERQAHDAPRNVGRLLLCGIGRGGYVSSSRKTPDYA